MSRALKPNLLTPPDLQPDWQWEKRLPASGHMSVDFERRIDHDRLLDHIDDERILARAREIERKSSGVGT